MLSTGIRFTAVAQKERGITLREARFPRQDEDSHGFWVRAREVLVTGKNLPSIIPLLALGLHTAHVCGHLVLGAPAHCSTHKRSAINSCVKN